MTLNAMSGRTDLLFFLRSWKALRFGLILMALSSAGQTFFVALYGSAFRESFRISDGDLGAAYAVGTVGSAATLGYVGRLIDRTTVARYTVGVAILLVGACLVTALSPNALVLVLAFYLLRLGGQGLMVHTAMTSTARMFPADVGKALGVISLGMSLAAAVLPPLAVAILGAIGWRWSWALNAGAVALGSAVAIAVLPRHTLQDKPSSRGGEVFQDGPLWRERRIWLTLPVLMAPAFIATGFFFHQPRLAEEKGWSLAWIAWWFGAYAITQAITQLAAGPWIDRLGPKRVLPFVLLPQCGAMLVLALSDALWAAPTYLILTGVSLAISSTLSTAIWMQLYGPEMLARLRSMVTATTVLASGASPVIMGILIDSGVPLSLQALACMLYMVCASLVALRL